MKNNLLVVLAGALGIFMVSRPMFAHHAGGMYDAERVVTLTGTVTEYAFGNPHVQIHFDVKNDQGVSERWTAETAPPQRMYRAGWTTKTLKAGDQITITGHPAKDGRKMMQLQKVVGPDGQEIKGERLD